MKLVTDVDNVYMKLRGEAVADAAVSHQKRSAVVVSVFWLQQIFFFL